MTGRIAPAPTPLFANPRAAEAHAPALPPPFDARFAVSDPLARMGDATDEYRVLVSAPHHLGRRRGPRSTRFWRST